MSMPVTAFSTGAPAAGGGLFTGGNASTGGTDFMAVMAAMAGNTAEAATGTEEQAPGHEPEQEPEQEQGSVAETPAAPYLNTVSPFRNHLSEVRVAVPGEATVEAVPAGPAEAEAPAPVKTGQDTADRETPEAPAADGRIPAVALLPAQVPTAVPAPAAAPEAQRDGHQPAAAPAAGPAVAMAATPALAVAADTAAASPAAPLQVLAAMAGRPAEAEPVMVPANLQAVQAADTVRPQAFTGQETAAPAPIDPPAAPAVQPAPAPAQAQTPAVNVSAPQAAAAPAPVQQPLHTQLAKPMFTLAAAGNGEHVMTMKVTPEDLGTVTVRAVIGPEGVRMELFAADAGREAVKAIMPELRRELAGAGLNASLDLGTGARPETSGGEGRQQRESRTTESDPRQGQREQPPAHSQRMFTDRAASLDVLA